MSFVSEDGRRTLIFEAGTCKQGEGSPSGGSTEEELNKSAKSTYGKKLEPTNPKKGQEQFENFSGPSPCSGDNH